MEDNIEFHLGRFYGPDKEVVEMIFIHTHSGRYMLFTGYYQLAALGKHKENIRVTWLVFLGANSNSGIEKLLYNLI